MAFFARDILGGCYKKAKFARHFGKFTSDFFRATFEEVFFDGFGCARHIWKVFLDEALACDILVAFCFAVLVVTTYPQKFYIQKTIHCLGETNPSNTGK